MPKTSTLYVRLDADLLEALDEARARRRESRRSLVERVLAEYLRRLARLERMRGADATKEV